MVEVVPETQLLIRFFYFAVKLLCNGIRIIQPLADGLPLPVCYLLFCRMINDISVLCIAKLLKVYQSFIPYAVQVRMLIKPLYTYFIAAQVFFAAYVHRLVDVFGNVYQHTQVKT